MEPTKIKPPVIESRGPARRTLTGWAAALSLTLPAISLPALAFPAVANAQSAAAPGGPGTDIADLVSRYGLRPMTPPSPAADFTLPNLAGGETSLSEYQGTWVVLTFWATWCGPCRSEMPTLETLHQQTADSGVTVLGVSIDRQRAPVDPYLKQTGVTFPNLWDAAGRAAQLYRASSIPLSYLVDPQGKLVAVSRGARNWAALRPMITALQGTSSDDATGAQYAAETDAVALPPILDPPTAEVVLSTLSPSPGEPFFLDVQMQWAGNFEEYLPHPPDVALPEGVVQEKMTASTSSRDGNNRIVYRLTLKAEQPGRFALDPVELRYTPRFESMPLATQLQGPTVEVQAGSLGGLSPAVVAGTLGGVAGVGLLALFWLRRRKTAGSSAEGSGDTEGAAHRERLDEARSLRLQGKAAAAFTVLAELELKLGIDDELARATRRMELEQARYGGKAPASDELDRLQRALDRRVAATRSSPEAERRKALRLRERET